MIVHHFDLIIYLIIMVFADECSSVKILSLNLKFDNRVHKILKEASVETTKTLLKLPLVHVVCVHSCTLIITVLQSFSTVHNIIWPSPNGSHPLQLLEGIAHDPVTLQSGYSVLCSVNIYND